MKKARYLLACALLVLSGSAFAEGFYGDAQLGFANMDAVDDDLGFVLTATAGVPVKDIEGFTAEGDFYVTLKGPEVGTADFDYWGVAGFAAYTMPITDAMSLTGRLGLAYSSVDQFGGGSEFQMDVAMGFRANLALADNMKVVAGLTELGGVFHLTAGVGIAFE